jgi:1,2-dihydroxy-3-keto-5-methylthiopentene dioxygenase
MTLLTVWSEDAPATALVQTADRSAIASELADIGVSYEHLGVMAVLEPTASPDEIIAAHRPLVDRLVAEHGYTLVDAVQLHPSDDPEFAEKAAGARAKFLNEHTHAEEEIRFFSQGSGVFYLHVEGRVLAMLCTEGDLISVPELTTHWFDMGTRPDFTALRFFRTDDGWVGEFTGSDIATRFATADELVEAARTHA